MPRAARKSRKSHCGIIAMNLQRTGRCGHVGDRDGRVAELAREVRESCDAAASESRRAGQARPSRSGSRGGPCRRGNRAESRHASPARPRPRRRAPAGSPASCRPGPPPAMQHCVFISAPRAIGDGLATPGADGRSDRSVHAEGQRRWTMLAGPLHGVEIATARPADRHHLPQPVLSRVEQRDRARTRARPAVSAPASSAGPAAPSSSPCSPCSFPSACGSTATARAAPSRRSRCSPSSARSGSRVRDRRHRPDRRPHDHRPGLRGFLHVGRVPVRALVRAGEARDGALLGLRRLQPRHARRRHAARLDRRHGRMAQRLPRPRGRHAGGRRALLSVRARPAARIHPADDASRIAARCLQRPVAGLAHARACCRCCRCTSSPTPRCSRCSASGAAPISSTSMGWTASRAATCCWPWAWPRPSASWPTVRWIACCARARRS